MDSTTNASTQDSLPKTDEQETDALFAGWPISSRLSASPSDKGVAVGLSSAASSASSSAIPDGKHASPSAPEACNENGKGQKQAWMSQSDHLEYVLSRNRDAREHSLKLKLESRLLIQRESQAAAAIEADKARAHELKLMEMRIRLAQLSATPNGYVTPSVPSPLSAQSPSSDFANLPYPSLTDTIPPVETFPTFPSDTLLP